MDLKSILAARQAELAGLVAKRNALGDEGNAILAVAKAEARGSLTEEESTRSATIRAERATLKEQISAIESDIVNIERELADDDKSTRAAETSGTVNERGVAASGVRVTSEPRTYMRESDPHGKQFLLDVARSQVMGDGEAQQRLSRHMTEERVEREAAGRPLVARASTTGSFTGLIVPQYLTEAAATFARGGRPFADACRQHDLPGQGMTVNISKITTGSSVAIQTEGNTVSATDIDDTLLTLNVLTAAGSQSTSRQALERGAGVEDITIQDLFSEYNRNLDSTLLNQATNGLTNVATSIAYTDADPSAAELYPKLLAGPSAVEAALLDADPGNTIAVMHSRRWYWLNAALSSSFPLLQQPGILQQAAGLNNGGRYGSGFRGILPSGIPVIVDNNIATNLGAGTNQDEIYFVSQSESHLWEDPNAPMLIRAEQTQSKSLLVDFVVYGYFAYTFTRRAHAQKIAGTGLVTPTFA